MTSLTWRFVWVAVLVPVVVFSSITAIFLKGHSTHLFQQLHIHTQQQTCIHTLYTLQVNHLYIRLNNLELYITDICQFIVY